MAIGASEAEAFWTEFALAGPARAAWREAVDLRRPQGSEGRRYPDPRRHLAKMPRALRPQPAGPCRPPGPARRLRLRRHRLRPGGRRSAKVQWRQVADQLRPKVPKLAVLMDEAEHDVLAYMTFPKEHRQKLHSTNPIERLHAEVKRRTNVVGIFPNEAAITRLVGAILLEQNDEWAVSRRYMTLESIAPLSAPSRCPPWQPERPGPTRREPRRAQRSYTTRRDTIAGPSYGLTGQPATPRTASQKMDQFYAALWTYFAPPLTAGPQAAAISPRPYRLGRLYQTESAECRPERRGFNLVGLGPVGRRQKLGARFCFPKSGPAPCRDGGAPAGPACVGGRRHGVATEFCPPL